MIVVNFNKPEFEYDVHSLIKAFFPKEDVEMYYTCSPEEVSGQNVACTHRNMEDLTQEELEKVTATFSIDYRENDIRILWAGEQEHRAEFAVDFSDRRETKNRLKQNLYELLEKGSGQTLPWGTLTGIRPTKIPMK